MALKLSYRTDKTQDVKTVFTLDIDDTNIKDYFEPVDVTGWMKRGFAIYIEDLGRKQGTDKVVGFLNRYSVPHTFEENVPVAVADEMGKVAKKLIAMGATPEDVKAFIASKGK